MARTGVVRYVIDCGKDGRLLLDVHADRTVQAQCRFTEYHWGEKQPMERHTAALVLRVWRGFARKGPNITVYREVER